MRSILDVLFGTRAQLVIGLGGFVVGGSLWILGCFVIPGAWAAPWNWQPVAYVLHVSMFYGQIACWSVVSSALGYRETKRLVRPIRRLEAEVVDTEKLEVGSDETG